MAKRQMVQVNLIKNSIAAYMAAVELHNKPNIPYRYETVTLLMINAWELALKAFIKKYIKSKSIYEREGHTISFDKALKYVNDYKNEKKKKSFLAIKSNLERIEEYRNNITHYYCDELEPYIFMLIAKSAINYVDFMKTSFSKDVMANEGLFIMPLGFKLPFKPEEFLSENVAKYASSEAAKKFINEMVSVIEYLHQENIEESIVVGFDLYLESVKNATNSDLLVAITSHENATASISRVTNVRFDATANQVVNLSDQQFRSIWKYTHEQLVAWCKENIDGFKKNQFFNEAKKSIWGDMNCVFDKKLDSTNSKSASQKFYTELGLKRIKEYYESHGQVLGNMN